MMRLPPFRYLAPKSLEEAVNALSDTEGETSPVAGGTDLFPNMKRLQVKPSCVVGLRGVEELKGVQLTGGNLCIGAGTTLTQLIENDLVRSHCAPLARAALTIATPLLRNMGTLGGNLCLETRCHFLNQTAFWRQAAGSCLKTEGDICRVAPGGDKCWAISSADLPPLLIVLGAKICLVGKAGEREIPLEELYLPDGIKFLAKRPDEILTEVRIPPLGQKRAGYLKLRKRGTFDFPALGVAASLELEGDGTCRSAHIVLGAISPTPLWLDEAETLVGERLTPEVINGLADHLQRKARPMQLSDYTHSYRRKMVGIYVSRLLSDLAGIAQ